jgi:hypothetical protein
VIVLLVTWFTFNQAPATHETAFSSARACEAARQQVLAEARRLKAENDQELAQMYAGRGPNPGPAPHVTAVCAQR